MGSVANSLLGTGEENVQADVTLTSSDMAAPESHRTPASPEDSTTRTSPVLSLEQQSSARKIATVNSVGSNSEGSNSEKESVEVVSSVSNIDHNSGTSDVGTTVLADPDSGTTETRKSVPPSGTTETGSVVLADPDSGTTNAGTLMIADSGSGTTDAESAKSAPTPSKVSVMENSFEQAMASAGELEEKWFLTFEQFVGALQREPFLCQFFAEQNSIDLSGTSVDPVLNPYTRTILATSP